MPEAKEGAGGKLKTPAKDDQKGVQAGADAVAPTTPPDSKTDPETAPLAPTAFDAVSKPGPGVEGAEKEPTIIVYCDHQWTCMRPNGQHVVIRLGNNVVPASLRDSWALKAHKCTVVGD